MKEQLIRQYVIPICELVSADQILNLYAKLELHRTTSALLLKYDHTLLFPYSPMLQGTDHPVEGADLH